MATVNGTTNSLGLANFSYDLNANNYYGKWRVQAVNGSLGANTTFIYNWWGCAISGTNCNGHGSQSLTSTIVAKNSPYLSGRDRVTGQNTAHRAAATNCTFCHQSFDGLAEGVNPVVNHMSYTSDVHRTISCNNASCHGDFNVHGTSTTSGNMIIASCYNATAGCHGNAAWGRNDISNKSTLNTSNVQISVSLYSYNNASTFNATFHTPNSTVPCVICHGPMHNITKPDETQRFIRNNNTESSHCTDCHTSYNKHNNSVSCTLCHSDDVHDIQVFAQNATYADLNRNNPNPVRGNCINCHQNSSFFAALESRPKAGNYTGRDPPQIPVPMNHSIDPMSGALWNGTQSRYWDNTSQVNACNYCHGSTLHSISALGIIGNVKGINNLNQSLTSSTWCANCHYKNAPGYGGNVFTPQPPEVLNRSGLVPANSRDGTGFYNHSDALSPIYDDATCKNCHNNNLNAGATSLNFSHNVGIGQAGGANCTNCHNTGGSAGAGKLVNISAMNDANAIHSNLNSGATTTLPEENKKCWACHGNGSQPSGGHPSTYKTPYKCPDCHVPDAGQNLNFTPKNTILNVTQHYWNGTNITTSGVTSCYSCHNRTEMMLGTNIDPDGAASVYGGANGGNNSSSHYGKKRNDMASMDNYTYCSYCHNTTTNNATFYVSDYNNTIYNHTFRDTTPLCGNCHNTGRIHNSTLVKPVSNDTLCKTCHGTGGSAITNNKTEHKTLYCTECHANSSTGTLAGKDIHDIKYLTQSNSFSSSNSSAVNCTTCHQENIVDLSLIGFNPFKIATPLHHGDNANNGSVWGNYWINTTPQTACIYCHGDTKHNSTPVGRILQWEQDYRLFGSINTNTTCANCHYRGDSNYTQMNSSLASSGLATPPEITNDTNWMGTSANYYNHSLDSYADQNCKTCHGSLLSAQTNMSEFMHTIATGVAGGADCVSCHNISGNGAPGDRRINASSLKLSAHKNINANAINTSVLDPINKACWACHGNGTQPDKHPVNYLYPKPCEYCHVNNNFNATPVYQHYPGSVFSGSIVYDNFDPNRTCVSCHNNSLVANQNITYGGYAAEKLKNASVSHYVVNRTFGESMPSAVTGILPDTRATTGTNFGCNKCHNTGAVGKDYGNARILPSSHNKMGSTGISCQSSCHNSNPQVNLTLHDKNTGIYVGSNGCFSSGCHIQPSTGGRRKR